jgi:hypothetical protein
MQVMVLVSAMAITTISAVPIHTPIKRLPRTMTCSLRVAITAQTARRNVCFAKNEPRGVLLHVIGRWLGNYHMPHKASQGESERAIPDAS